MTDQTIIDDAKADAGKQEQEPVAWMNGNLEYDDLVTNADKNNMFHANYAFYQKHLTIPLFTSPPQPQTVADALEMAVKVVVDWDYLASDKWIAQYGDITIEDAIRNLITTQPQSGWISVKDKLPNDGELVIAYERESGTFPATHYQGNWANCEINNPQDYWNVEFWMSLPDAPSIQGNTE